MPELRPYIGNADVFPILRHWDFFNHAGVAPAAARGRRGDAPPTPDQAETGAYLGTDLVRRHRKAPQSPPPP